MGLKSSSEAETFRYSVSFFFIPVYRTNGSAISFFTLTFLHAFSAMFLQKTSTPQNPSSRTQLLKAKGFITEESNMRVPETLLESHQTFDEDKDIVRTKSKPRCWRCLRAQRHTTYNFFICLPKWTEINGQSTRGSSD